MPIGLKVDPRINPITEDTTLNISTTGSDTTGDGSSTNPFATVNGALDYLKDKTINSDSTVTIQLADGHYTNQVTIEPKHPDGDKIIITGENYYDISMTSVQSSSGSTGAWSIVLNVSDVSNIVDGDYVLITGSANGTYPELIEGCWEITNVDSGNTRITITNTTNWTSAPSGAVTADIRVIKSVLSFSASNHGIVCRHNTINVSNIVLVGGGNYFGIYAYDNGSINGDFDTQPIGINNFENGVLSNENGFIKFAAYSAVSNISGSGLTADIGGVIHAHNCSFNGNGNGIVCNNASHINATNVVSCGNGSHGIYALHNSVIEASTSKSMYNLGYGVHTQFGADIVIPLSTISYNDSGVISIFNSGSNIQSATITNNTNFGIQAATYSYIWAGSSTVSSNGTNYSPAADTQGNVYGYIDT